MRILTRRGAALLAPTLLLAALASGCGSNGPSNTTTTNQSAQNGQQGGGQNVATQAFAYARCMRTHGVSNFPDPHVSVSPGHSAVGFAVNPSETGSPKFKSADKACSGILPGPSSPAQQQAQQQAHKRGLLAFAHCARTHGLRDFPDPNTAGQITPQTLTAAGVDIHSEQFLNAAKACVGVSGGVVSMPQIEAAVHGGQ
ncbi:MAG: hypothetical protein ACRDPA_21435 [Solirubrobacteraceae bacterium]